MTAVIRTNMDFVITASFRVALTDGAESASAAPPGREYLAPTRIPSDRAQPTNAPNRRTAGLVFSHRSLLLEPASSRPHVGTVLGRRDLATITKEPLATTPCWRTWPSRATSCASRIGPSTSQRTPKPTLQATAIRPPGGSFSERRAQPLSAAQATPLPTPECQPPLAKAI
jgi:hypothetical protein